MSAKQIVIQIEHVNLNCLEELAGLALEQLEQIMAQIVAVLPPDLQPKFSSFIVDGGDTPDDYEREGCWTQNNGTA